MQPLSPSPGVKLQKESGLHPDQSLSTSCNKGLWEFSILIMDMSLRSSKNCCMFVCLFITKTMQCCIAPGSWMPQVFMRIIHKNGF